MKKYVEPYVANYGDCQELIQGACFWGGENWTLDQKGSVKRKVRHWVWLNDKHKSCVTSKVCNGKNNC